MKEILSNRHTAREAGASLSAVLQRTCACGKPSVDGGECAECRKKRELGLQRAARSEQAPGQAPPIVHEVLRSPGQPLDAGTRAALEPRFGHDFSGVRVHTDGRAAASAGAVNALAYTVGRDVVFGAGQYAPTTSAGQRLLAHELAHVVQQRHTAYSPHEPLSVGAADNQFEQQARGAESLASGQPASEAAWGQAQALGSAGAATAARTLQRRVNPNFVSCNPPSAAIAAVTGPDPVGVITAANARAIELLDTVIEELQTTRDSIIAGAEVGWPTISDGVAQALTNRFHIDPSNRTVWTGRGEGSVDVLIRRFRGARQILNDGWMRYQCLGGAAVNFTFGGVTCAGAGCVGDTRAVSCAGVSQLVLCAPFWGDGADDQAATLLHECFHIYFEFISDAGNLANAHCYEQFVADLNNVPVPAIFVGSCP